MFFLYYLSSSLAAIVAQHVMTSLGSFALIVTVKSKVFVASVEVTVSYRVFCAMEREAELVTCAVVWAVDWNMIFSLKCMYQNAVIIVLEGE